MTFRLSRQLSGCAKLNIRTGPAAFLFSLVLFASACSMTDRPAERVPRPAEPVAPEVDELLREAALALEVNRLTTPAEDNAYDRYLEVLRLDPDNDLARNGINTIVETYLAWALDNAERNNFSRARQYVTRAQSVDGSHPNIRPVVNRINDLEDSDVTVFSLDAEQVLNRTVSGREFTRIARKIARHDAFVEIRAPTDASGRWIYQQLNQRVDRRITARFVLSSEPSVSVDI